MKHIWVLYIQADSETASRFAHLLFWYFWWCGLYWKAFHVWLDLSVIHRNLCMWKFADQRKNERQIWPHNVILIHTLNHYRAERKNWSIKKNSVATRPSTELKASQKPPNFRYKQCTLRLYDCGVHVQTGCK